MPEPLRCAMTGQEQCVLPVLRELREVVNKISQAFDQHEEIFGVLTVFKESLDRLVAQHADLVAQDRESKREFIAALQNRVPQGFVPMKTHMITILVALGITQLPTLAKIFEYYVR